ncbi:replication-associated recombination protein A [Clostridium gasigenes]|uniref:Putative ATPase n=1 Tax=Clostridium gasigenes TaxID=94869 RepID=A0A1H0RFE0_9CLOT|nr:replication-associated recombination protein A [Clostridium gasigenes]MBB6623065.1 replication-associated recombination protein A [Clostridium gasigenes]MBU3087835.1 replication-associated recombination protein A [Clostridium gasigenes]MBU3132538.1 replication-associated recombination protein A [Clostridium gasigenes]SDP28267.1 putative ATPase [Clostridium gasigenes]
MYKPLAELIRPKELSEVCGQQHILGENKILNRILKSGAISNMIFYGPPGVGKTTVANIIAKQSGKRFHKLNATNSSLKDIQEITNELDTFMGMNGVVLYLDEIQNFNKKQQQSLLEYIEDGRITLIASTTENPYHYIFKALLSRSTIFEFKPIEETDIKKALNRVIEIKSKDYKEITLRVEEEAINYLATYCNGDVRKSINGLEVALNSTNPNEEGILLIDLDVVRDSTQSKVVAYDMKGDSHYDILSAFQKSIRGSDPDAAIHYLARLIKAGDLISICRRLLVMASEDIGLAYPQASIIVKSLMDTARELGFPEARIPLAEATILLATSPKSNTAYLAIDAALKDLENLRVDDIPNSMKDAHYSGAVNLGRGVTYKYPHNYENSYVKQQYLPDNLASKVYYQYGDNKLEKTTAEYWRRIKN